MKIRMGFVSNSSSSSFVLMSSEKKWNEAKEGLGAYAKAMIEQITETDTLFGESICMIGDLCVQDTSYTFDDFSIDMEKLSEKEVEAIEKDPYYEDNENWEAYYEFEAKLKEVCKPDEYVEWGM